MAAGEGKPAKTIGKFSPEQQLLKVIDSRVNRNLSKMKKLIFRWRMKLLLYVEANAVCFEVL